MEGVNGISDGGGGGPPPPSPLTGCYLLIVIGEPHSPEHKEIILRRVAKGLLSWDLADCMVDLEKELAIITEQAPEGEEARYGERLIQYASENLVTEILIHPAVSTLSQCVRNLLSSFTRHRHIIHSGYTFAANGSWALQDGTFSLADFSEAFQELEVQRVIRAYDNGISVDIHCSPEGDWARLPKESFAKNCKVRLNPVDVLPSSSASIADFLNYITPFLVPLDIVTALESSEVVGNIRFSHPTLYVFPGGQGDAALFGINGFNMLLDGGFSRKACFWDFVRHLDRLDAVLLTRLNNSNVSGIMSVLKRKRQNAVYPQIGHFFCNIKERKALLSPDGDKDKDPLLINLMEEGHDIVTNLKHLNLHPQACYRDSEPINLYHKVGHGTLDMYVLSPAKDSREVREFIQKWNSSDYRLFANPKTKEFSFPLPNLVSICALLVWQPSNSSENITRILFPGSTPQNKIFEGLDRLKQLDCIKYPVCSEISLNPPKKTKEQIFESAKSQKILPEVKKEKSPRPNDIKSKPLQEKDNKTNDEVKEKKEIKKSDSTDSDKSAAKNNKVKETSTPVTKTRARDKDSKSTERKPTKVEEKKKPSPTTPKKTITNGDATTKAKKLSPTTTPAKSAKEASNRKVLESKKQAPKEKPKPADKQDKKPEQEKKTERKPISRRPKPAAAGVKASTGSPIRKKPESIAKKAKLDKEGTDSSTVSTPTADEVKRDISKLTTEELDQLKAQELADLQEEQEVVQEIEAVFRKGEEREASESEMRKINNISIEVEEKTDEEYLVVEKIEGEEPQVDDKVQEDVQDEVQEEAQEEVVEDEIQKLQRDSEESEKQRKLSEPKVDVAKEIISPEEKVDKVESGTQPDEKFSATVESGATTAPTLPENEQIPLDEIKEKDDTQVIEEKHVKEETKEKDIPIIQLPSKSIDSVPPVKQVPVVPGIRLDKQQHIRDIVKTPDEVADLPVHEVADHYADYQKTTDEQTTMIVKEALQEAKSDVQKVEEEVKAVVDKIIEESKDIVENGKDDKGGDVEVIDDQEEEEVKVDEEEEEKDIKVIEDVLEVKAIKEVKEELMQEKDIKAVEETISEVQKTADISKVNELDTETKVDTDVEVVKEEVKNVEELIEAKTKVEKVESKISEVSKEVVESKEIEEVCCIKQKVEETTEIEETVTQKSEVKVENIKETKETVSHEETKETKDIKEIESQIIEETNTEKINGEQIIEEIKKIDTKMSGKSDVVEETITKVLKSSEEIIEEAVTTKEEIVSSVTTQVTEKITDIQKTVEDTATSIAKVEETVVQKIEETTKEKVEQVKEIETKIQEEVSSLKETVAENVESVKETVTKEIEEIEVKGEDIVNEVTSEVTKKIESVTDEVVAVKETIVQESVQVVEDVKHVIEEKTDSISGFFSKGLSRLEEATKSFGDKISEGVDKVLGETKVVDVKDEVKEEKEVEEVVEELEEKKQVGDLTASKEDIGIDQEAETQIIVQNVDVDLPEMIHTKESPESPCSTPFDYIDKVDLGRKSPKEREQDVAKIVASVAEVLKSEAPLEDFKGKIPLEITTFPTFTPYTTELRETHITTVDSPMTDMPGQITPIKEEKIDEVLKEMEDMEDIDSNSNKSKISDLIKTSNELLEASSKMISGIKERKEDEIIEEDEEVEDVVDEVEETADVENVTTVHRMLVTASSEDGGEETVICPPGSITFAKSAESSGKSSPDFRREDAQKPEQSSPESSQDAPSVLHKEPEISAKMKSEDIPETKDKVDIDDKKPEVSEVYEDNKETEARLELELEKENESRKSSIADHDLDVKSGKSTPDMVKSGKGTPDIPKSGKETPEVSTKSGIVTPDISKSGVQTPDLGVVDVKSGKSTPDIPKSGKETPDIAKSGVATPDMIKSGKVTPELAASEKSTPDIPKSDKISEELPKSGKETPDIVKSGKSTPDIPKSGKETPEVLESGKQTPDKPKSGVATPDIFKSDKTTPGALSGKSTPDLPKSGNDTAEVPKSGKSTPDILKSGKSTPDIPKSGKETPDLPKSGKQTPDLAKSGKETPEIVKSGLATPDIPTGTDRATPDIVVSGKSTPDIPKIDLKTCDLPKSDQAKSEVITPDVAKSGKSTPDVPEIPKPEVTDVTINGRATPDVPTVGKATPDQEKSKILPQKETSDVLSGKETPDISKSGKSTPDVVKNDILSVDNVKSGKSTPDISTDIKDVKDALSSGKQTPVVDDVQSGKATPDIGKVDIDTKSGKSTPDVTKSGKETPDLSATEVLAGKQTPEIAKSGKETPDLAKSEVLTGKQTPDVAASGKSTPDIPKSGKETPDLGKSEVLSGKQTPDLGKIELLSGKQTPEIEKSGKSTPDLTKSGKETPDLGKPEVMSGKSTPDIQKSLPDIPQGKITPVQDKVENLSIQHDQILNGKLSPDIGFTESKSKTELSEELSDIKSTIIDESKKSEISTVASTITSTTSESKTELHTETTQKESVTITESGKLSPDLVESTTDISCCKRTEVESSNVTSDLSISNHMSDGIESGKSSPEVNNISGKSSPDLVREKSPVPEKRGSAQIEMSPVLSGKQTPDVSKSGKSTPDLGKGDSIKLDTDSLASGKVTPDVHKIQSGKSTPDLPHSTAPVTQMDTDSLASGKMTPDLKHDLSSGKATPDVDKHSIHMETDSLASGKQTPEVPKMMSVVSGKSTPDLDQVTSGKSTPDHKEVHIESGQITESGKSTPDPHKEVKSQVSGKSTPDLIEKTETVTQTQSRKSSVVDRDLSGKLTPEPQVLSGKASPSPIQIEKRDSLSNNLQDLEVEDKAASGKTSPSVLRKDSIHLTTETVPSGKSTPTIPDAIVSDSGSGPVSGKQSGKATPDLPESLDSKRDSVSLSVDKIPSGKSTPDLKSGKTTPLPDQSKLETMTIDELQSGKSTPDKLSGKISPELVGELSGKSTPDHQNGLSRDRDSIASGKSTPGLSGKITPEPDISSGKITPEPDFTELKDKMMSGKSTPDSGFNTSFLTSTSVQSTVLTTAESLKQEIKTSFSSSTGAGTETQSPDFTKRSSIQVDHILSGKSTPDKLFSGKSTPDFGKRSSIQAEHILSGKSTPDFMGCKRDSLPISGHSTGKTSPVVTEDQGKITETFTDVTQLQSSHVFRELMQETITSSFEDKKEQNGVSAVHDTKLEVVKEVCTSGVSGKSTPELLKEKDSRKSSVMSVEVEDEQDSDYRKFSITSENTKTSSMMSGKSTPDKKDSAFVQAFIDAERFEASPSPVKSETKMTTSGFCVDPMATSFYGALPDDSDEDDLQQEHQVHPGHELHQGATSGVDLMSASFIGDLPTSSTPKQSTDDKVKDSKDVKETKDTKDIKDKTEEEIKSWGKPLGLPSPAPPTDNKGTPKKEKRLPMNVSVKNKLNQRSESPSKKKKVNPIYVDLTYVPHHGNSYYSQVEFFKRVRARYYVFSGIEPSKEVYNALLEAKQTWEDKDLEVTIIPTYDTDVLGYWVAENEELLTKFKIDLSPSASRCTINLQDHETSCSAYRLEF